jgi:hypothetical protein
MRHKIAEIADLSLELGNLLERRQVEVGIEVEDDLVGLAYGPNALASSGFISMMWTPGRDTMCSCRKSIKARR